MDFNADMLARYLSRLLSEWPEERREKLIVIGHSLGSQVLVNLSGNLSRRGIKVRQLILLGSAVPYDDARLADCAKACSEPPMSLFKPSDRVLRYLYLPTEHKPALGQAGAKERIAGLREYRIKAGEDEEAEKLGDKMNSHRAAGYFTGLGQVLQGAIPPETCKIDHHAIAAPTKLPIPIPESVGTIEDQDYDWLLISYTMPKLKLPEWLKKQEEKEAPPEEDNRKALYVIRNPYGECCGGGFDRDKIVSKFAEIKARLAEQSTSSL